MQFDLDKSAETKVFLDDNICRELVYAKNEAFWDLTIYCSHDEADLSCVGGTGEVGVDLLCLMLVEADKAVEDVVAGKSIVVAAFVVREVVLHRAHWEFLLESINLVQEQDDRCLDEPSGIADGVEQSKGLLHTVDSLVFKKQLIIFGNSNEEEDSGDILKAVDPLLSLRTLSTNIEHTVCKISNNEGGFGDTSGLYTRSEDVLVIWHIIWLCNALNVVKVAREDVSD